MMNILIPMASSSPLFNESEYPFPRALIEVKEKTIIENVVENLRNAEQETQFIFVVSNHDCRRYHLDMTLGIITNGNGIIIKLDKDTKGSACSALMAIEHINNDTPLLIANSDQLFDNEVNQMIYELKNYDAGVVCFDSVHPRWSYARTDDKNNVLEIAEKRPISRNAIAGLYYFGEGRSYIESSMQMIQKGDSINGTYYVAPAINQMILAGKQVKMTKVDNANYHTFYNPQKIEEYVRTSHNKLNGI